MSNKQRKKIDEIILNGPVDINEEYIRLYKLLHYRNMNVCTRNMALYTVFNDLFMYFDIRGTSLTLDDFNKTHSFNFASNIHNVALNDLVLFCEYFYNLILSFMKTKYVDSIYDVQSKFLIEQIERVVDKISYKLSWRNDMAIFVPNSQAAVAVAEILEDDVVSYDVLNYNHHALKRDIISKKAILKRLADLLEPKRSQLESIDKTLADNLFFAFNNINIRHNNVDPAKKSTYKKVVAQMPNNEIEKIYDDIYQMELLAFLLIDNATRQSEFKKIKNKINKV